MILLVLGGAAVLILVLARIVIGRSLVETRQVHLHVPIATAWEAVRDFPALLARHGRGRSAVQPRGTVLMSGDGRSAGSVWRLKGRWGAREYWADVELVEWEPPGRLSVRLARDSFGSQHGLARHRGILTLTPDSAAGCRLSWRLEARLRGFHLMTARLLSEHQVRIRLLDLSLRSLKVAVDGARTPAARPIPSLDPPEGGPEVHPQPAPRPPLSPSQEQV